MAVQYNLKEKLARLRLNSPAAYSVKISVEITETCRSLQLQKPRNRKSLNLSTCISSSLCDTYSVADRAFHDSQYVKHSALGRHIVCDDEHLFSFNIVMVFISCVTHCCSVHSTLFHCYSIYYMTCCYIRTLHSLLISVAIRCLLLHFTMLFCAHCLMMHSLFEHCCSLPWYDDSCLIHCSDLTCSVHSFVVCSVITLFDDGCEEVFYSIGTFDTKWSWYLSCWWPVHSWHYLITGIRSDWLSSDWCLFKLPKLLKLTDCLFSLQCTDNLWLIPDDYSVLPSWRGITGNCMTLLLRFWWYWLTDVDGTVIALFYQIVDDDPALLLVTLLTLRYIVDTWYGILLTIYYSILIPVDLMLFDNCSLFVVHSVFSLPVTHLHLFIEVTHFLRHSHWLCCLWLMMLYSVIPLTFVLHSDALEHCWLLFDAEVMLTVWYFCCCLFCVQKAG